MSLMDLDPHPGNQWCCKDVCTNVINILIEEGQVASYDGNNILTDLGNVGGCKASAGQCISTEGTILWGERNVTNDVDGVVEGIVSGIGNSGNNNVRNGDSGHWILKVTCLLAIFTNEATLLAFPASINLN
uniref:Uncharacterized protein n=1 Tax=Romanomermis culicivorax TaxID=13658 RepID=A0A915I5K4_ROMCU